MTVAARVTAERAVGHRLCDARPVFHIRRGGGPRDRPVAARVRGAARGRPGRRALPEPADRGRPARSRHPEGRRRLLHDLLQLRQLSGADHLAQLRPGELDPAQGGAQPQHRLGLGGQPGEARRPLLPLHSRQGAAERHLRHLGRQHRPAVERPQAAGAARPYQLVPRGWRGRVTLAVPVGGQSGAGNRPIPPAADCGCA